MVKAILKAIKNLAEIIETIFNIISNIMGGIVMFFRVVIRFISVIFQELYLLPNWIYPFAYLTISITIVLIIINRRKAT